MSLGKMLNLELGASRPAEALPGRVPTAEASWEAPWASLGTHSGPTAPPSVTLGEHG